MCVCVCVCVCLHYVWCCVMFNVGVFVVSVMNNSVAILVQAFSREMPSMTLPLSVKNLSMDWKSRMRMCSGSRSGM